MSQHKRKDQVMLKSNLKSNESLSLQFHENDGIRDNRYLRCSSIGDCSRKIGYQLLGYQPLPDNSHSKFILSLGNAIHDLIQRKLVALGWVKAKPILSIDGQIDWEQTEEDPLSGCELNIIDHELRIIGHCDGVSVPLKKEGEDYTPDLSGKRYLIEIKSISDKPRFWVLGIRDGGKNWIHENDYPSEFIEIDVELSSTSKTLQQRVSKFQHSREVRSVRFGKRMCPVYKVMVEGKEEDVTIIMIGNSIGAFSSLNKPKPEHIQQASLYASQLGLEDILFIYVGKDVDPKHYTEDEFLNLPIKIFETKVTPLSVDLIKEKIGSIYKYTDEETLPPQEYKFGEDHSPCKWCPFLWQCYPEQVDISSITCSLSKLGIESLIEGPGVIHEYSSNLKEEYKDKDAV